MNSNLGIPLVKLAVRSEAEIVSARQKTRRIAGLLGFDSQDQVRLATAVSELARNIFQYAKQGNIEFFFLEPAQSLNIRASDQGPGIRNLNDILNGLYVSQSGMGVGLLGTKRLMDDFQIKTSAEGTVVQIGKQLDKRARIVTKAAIDQLTQALITSQPENPFEEMQHQNRELLAALEESRTAKEELSRLNSELSQLNAELAETNRGVVALYAELDEKAESLQRANEVKTSFLSNMTHEFRTPLSSVISLTRLLLSRIDGELTTEQEKQVQYIRQASEGLLELVNDLLDLAKVEAGKVSIHAANFEIEELLSGLRGVFRPILNNENLELVIEHEGEKLELETDQPKLSQILRNLISNAIKFTEKGRVRVCSRLAPSGMLHFTVEDTGVGIAPEFLETIFEDFSQVQSKLQRKQKGTGLGLPLSRKLARLLGGDLWVESVVGEGSRFHVVVPFVYQGASEGILIRHTEGAKPDIRRVLEEPEATAQFRVLLIDDDEASRYILKNLVREELDADFAEISNGRDGLEKIRRWNPDLVFLDLAMPEMDGFEVLHAIRLNSDLQALPVIVNTARKLSPLEDRRLQEEATAVLSKERTDHDASIALLREALRKAGFDYKEKTDDVARPS